MPPRALPSVSSRPAHQRLGELEAAVLDQLGAQAAVAAEVDVLEEDAEQPRADARPGLRRRRR